MYRSLVIKVQRSFVEISVINFVRYRRPSQTWVWKFQFPVREEIQGMTRHTQTHSSLAGWGDPLQVVMDKGVKLAGDISGPGRANIDPACDINPPSTNLHGSPLLEDSKSIFIPFNMRIDVELNKNNPLCVIE